MNKFRHKLGAEVQTRVSGFKGIITSRSECLYGCNRYYITPKVDKDGKIPDGYWCDEDDVEVVNSNAISTKPKNTGGPMSKVC